jgi:hypothetical protein
MTTHKFRVGEKVKFTSDPSYRHPEPSRDYLIVQQLPESDGEFQYRIRSVHEQRERIAKESQLRRM